MCLTRLDNPGRSWSRGDKLADEQPRDSRQMSASASLVAMVQSGGKPGRRAANGSACGRNTPSETRRAWPANSGVRLRRLGNSALLLIASAASATLKGGGGLANRPIRRMRRGGVADCGSLVFIEVQRSVLRGVYAETDPLDPDGPHTGHRLGCNPTFLPDLGAAKH